MLPYGWVTWVVIGLFSICAACAVTGALLR